MRSNDAVVCNQATAACAFDLRNRKRGSALRGSRFCTKRRNTAQGHIREKGLPRGKGGEGGEEEGKKSARTFSFVRSFGTTERERENERVHASENVPG